MFGYLDDDADGHILVSTMLAWWNGIMGPDSERAQAMQSVLDELEMEADSTMDYVEYACALEEVHDIECMGQDAPESSFKEWIRDLLLAAAADAVPPLSLPPAAPERPVVLARTPSRATPPPSPPLVPLTQTTGPPAAAEVFEQLTDNAEGLITRSELFVWWTSTVVASRQQLLPAACEESGIVADDMLDSEDFEGILEETFKLEFKQQKHHPSSVPSFDTWFSGLFIHNGATQTDTINPLAASSSLRVDGDFVPASLDSPAQPLPATAEDIFAQLDDDQDGFVTGDSVLTWWASVTEPGSHRAQFMQRVFDENGIEAQQDMDFENDFECLLEELHELESETAAEQPPTFEQWCVGLYRGPPSAPRTMARLPPLSIAPPGSPPSFAPPGGPPLPLERPPSGPPPGPPSGPPPLLL